MTYQSPKTILAEIHQIVAFQQTDAVFGLTEVEACELEFRKWQLVHNYIHGRPFSTRTAPPRSEQWRHALDTVREVREPELIDWMVLQIDVARNLERGIQDMRPRKGGPCHPLILEYVGNRKRKALAVLHFAKDAEQFGCYRVNSSWHSRTAEILNRHQMIERDEDGNPVYTMDPLARS